MYTENLIKSQPTKSKIVLLTGKTDYKIKINDLSLKQHIKTLKLENLLRSWCSLSIFSSLFILETLFRIPFKWNCLKKKKKKGFYQAEKTEGLYCFLDFLNSIRTPKYPYSKDKQILFIRSTHVITCMPSWETSGKQVWDAVSCFSNGGLFRNWLISSDFCWSWSTEKKISRLKWSLAYIPNLMSYHLPGADHMLCCLFWFNFLN